MRKRIAAIFMLAAACLLMMQAGSSGKAGSDTQENMPPDARFYTHYLTSIQTVSEPSETTTTDAVWSIQS